MRIILYSNSLDTLNYEDMTTSSQKYEYKLAEKLKEKNSKKITILSNVISEENSIRQNNIELIGVKADTINKKINNLRSFFSKEKENDIIFVFYGYDLKLVCSMLYLKLKYKIKLISFIFDYHVGAIEMLSVAKRNLANIYFKIALILIKFCDGFILFQNNAAKELQLKKPYLVIKPAINPEVINNETPHRNSSLLTLTFAGTVNKYNGILALIEAIKENKESDLRVRIFGDGDLVESVKQLERSDSRVYYGGRISQELIETELKSADILLNLREPDHPVNKFAFPSKLIEFMGIGKPIISTNLGFEEEMKKSLYLLESLSSEDINKKILEIKQAKPSEIVFKTNLAKEYIRNNNNWDGMITKVYDFLNFINNK